MDAAVVVSHIVVAVDAVSQIAAVVVLIDWIWLSMCVECVFV